MDSVRELLIDQVQDLYDAEKQLVKVLPKLAKGLFQRRPEAGLRGSSGTDPRARGAIRTGLPVVGRQGQEQSCETMKGLVAEGAASMEEDLSEPLLDSAIIGAAQTVEHYEIAGRAGAGRKGASKSVSQRNAKSRAS